MEDYPDPNEEYELLYQEEMEAIRDMEEELMANSRKSRSRNFLTFDLPSDKEKVEVGGTEKESGDDSKDKEKVEVGGTEKESADDSRDKEKAEVGGTEKESADDSKKRCLSESVAGVSDLSPPEPPSKRHKGEVPSHERGITSRRIPDWPFMPITSESGEKLYIKIEDSSEPYDTSRYLSNNSKSFELLMTPFSKLKCMAEEVLQKKFEEAHDVTVESPAGGSDLWVEKYKPKTYFDLLSDESVNRTLLNWLKMWDKVVFKKEIKQKVRDDKLKVLSDLDKDGRPHYKIALLCGPPGLGKTTLAHAVAKLAGYEVVEINASDDRSVEGLGKKLDAATQNKSVMGNRKPLCLVLDEIDGAPGATIEFLLKYLDGKVSETGKKGKRGRPKGVLKRPVICICNEPYTPSLRQLRQQSFVVHFPNTSTTKLSQRLMEICRKQDLKTDLSTLALLCDKTQNDIRSCISTLYFFKSKTNRKFKSADVINSNLGQKDIQKGLFNLWKEIFHLPVKKPNFFKNVVDKGKEDEVSHHINYSRTAMERLHHIVQICQSAGEHEKLLQGVYENFPRSKCTGNLDSLNSALEWFSWFDLLDSRIKKNQAFVLLKYLPFGFGAWHSLFSSNSFWKINYPTAAYENHVKEMRCQQILNDVFRGLGPAIRSYNPMDPLLLDVLPLLNVILVPPIRSVNPTLFNEGEKKDFKQLVDIMIEFGLNFVQHRAPNGKYSYDYDPNIEELTRFNLKNSTNTRSFSYNMKQIISHEIELQKLRTVEESEPDPENPPKVDETTPSAEDTAGKTKEENCKEVQYKDFFGRIVKAKKPSSGDPAATNKSNALKSPIWFNFKAGYNNAVKKDVTMKDLL